MLVCTEDSQPVYDGNDVSLGCTGSVAWVSANPGGAQLSQSDVGALMSAALLLVATAYVIREIARRIWR